MTTLPSVIGGGGVIRSSGPVPTTSPFILAPSETEKGARILCTCIMASAANTKVTLRSGTTIIQIMEIPFPGELYLGYMPYGWFQGVHGENLSYQADKAGAGHFTVTSYACDCP